MKPLLEQMFEAFGTQVVLCHAKDVRASADGRVEWVAAGEGRFDYATFVSLLRRMDREIFLALEYVQEPGVDRALNYVRRFL